ncbi:glutathione S-transferase family protein [Acidimangrovimonas sediminis]|uniref:glutathione S-transferase family protein n=1 Tax=Acidimangrovimonas sediminis TaxID=2056283 RepID=UPI000C807881|nr:glutathione S-transferase family protein [Acidimangrovimonas sediminis]
MTTETPDPTRLDAHRGYTVIGPVNSRAARVLWMLEELGESYEHIPAAPRSEGVVAFNPAGKVPVLIDNGTPITDSTAIIQYLADKHGRLTFPAGTLGRARQDSLTQFLLDEFDAALWMAARHSFVLPEELRQSGVKATLKWEFERSEKVLVDRFSEGPFLMGRDMTVPDIVLGHCLVWALGAKFPVTQRRLSDYLDLIRARPAFQRAMAR